MKSEMKPLLLVRLLPKAKRAFFVGARTRAKRSRGCVADAEGLPARAQAASSTTPLIWSDPSSQHIWLLSVWMLQHPPCAPPATVGGVKAREATGGARLALMPPYGGGTDGGLEQNRQRLRKLARRLITLIFAGRAAWS